MKYEMIFGSEELFDNAPLGTELVGHSGGFYKNSPDGPIYCGGCTFTTDEYRNIGFIAARRVIRTPTWTVADQKAGKLPEVGSKLIYTETLDAFEFVGVIAGSMRWACKDFQDGFLYFFEQSEMSPIESPIESPEEKAARLREEWCNRAMDYSTIQQLYNAMLSGELPVPGKDGK